MYYLKFSDNTIFKGGTIHNSLWNTSPNKEIVEFKYEIGNKYLILSGYESYNHQLEKYNVFNKEIITKIILMRRKGEKVDCMVIDLKMKKIYKKEVKLHAEYATRPVTGWKAGIKGAIPLITY